MNLREEILKEHSKEHALKIANYACTSKKNFKALMQCFMSDEYRLAQRAAWSVSWAAKKKPVMITPFIKDLVAVLQKSNVHTAVIRNAVRGATSMACSPHMATGCALAESIFVEEVESHWSISLSAPEYLSQ